VSAATAGTLESAPAATTDERWRPSAQGWAARLAVYVLIFGGLIWVTANVPGYWADRISLAAVYAMIGLSLNIVLGYVGQVSLGHHGFVGIAAFVSAYYVTEKAHCTVVDGCDIGSFAVGVGLAAATGILAAGLLGVVALRIKGLYLALITLAYGFMAQTSIFEIDALTGGGAGMPAPRPSGFTSDRAYAYLTLMFLAAMLFVDWRLLRSKVGRAILALKHSEPVASSYGVNVTAYKIYAFMISGLFAGVAGALFAFRNTNVVSNDFDFAIALLWVLMVVIGGLGNRTGVVIGSAFIALFPFLAALIEPLDDWVTQDLGRAFDQFIVVIGAVLAITTLIRFPGGIAEQISPLTRWLRGQPFSIHPNGHHPPAPKEQKHRMLKKLGLAKSEESADDESKVEPMDSEEVKE
jgi:branched-chain amino acid transport system permease protein